MDWEKEEKAASERRGPGELACLRRAPLLPTEGPQCLGLGTTALPTFTLTLTCLQTSASRTFYRSP